MKKIPKRDNESERLVNCKIPENYYKYLTVKGAPKLVLIWSSQLSERYDYDYNHAKKFHITEIMSEPTTKKNKK